MDKQDITKLFALLGTIYPSAKTRQALLLWRHGR